VRRYLRDPTFSRFDTIPECDGHTHTDTRRRHIPRLARRHAVKTAYLTVYDSNVVQQLCILAWPCSSSNGFNP